MCGGGAADRGSGIRADAAVDGAPVAVQSGRQEGRVGGCCAARVTLMHFDVRREGAFDRRWLREDLHLRRCFADGYQGENVIQDRVIR